MDDADGDGVWNRLEWVQMLEEYEIVEPDFDDVLMYVAWAMDPSLPADEDVDIGLDLPDGDGTDWDYSHLPQGTVTFQSAQDLPIEIRILDPPGREDVPVTIGEPVDIPLGAELLITLAEGANEDWFYTWDADGQMIDGSAEKTERFRLMRAGTIRPKRRTIHSVQLPASPSGDNAYTWEWSGVGPFGHMITPGSSSGGHALAAPQGAYVKLRAYKLKEPPGGGTKDLIGGDKEYANTFHYDYDYTTYTTVSSSPKFNLEYVEDYPDGIQVPIPTNPAG